MSNRRVLRLVPSRVSKETCKRLEELLEQAKAGDPRLVGLAFVAIYQNSFYVDAVGEANRRPTLTRGAIRALDELMSERSRYK